MTTQTVPSDEQPDHFAEIAAELHQVADDVAKLIGSGLPKPRLFMLNIQPGEGRSNDDLTARSVDAMAQFVLGVNGQVEKMGGGSYHYGTDHLRRGPLEVVIYQGVSTEWALRHDVAAAKAELAEREAELEKARARVAELESERKPLVSDSTIAEAAAMEARDREAGGAPWEVADHPENAQPGGWHRGQIIGTEVAAR